MSEHFIEISDIGRLALEREQQEPNEFTIPGLQPIGPVSFSLNWESSATPAGLTRIFTEPSAMTEFTLRIKRTVQTVGRLWFKFETEDQRIVEIFMPMDRRQARRLARRLGRKFTMINREVVWR